MSWWRAPPARPTISREKLALQDLAARMADRPEGILPRLVDLALGATAAISGGLSLYERDGGSGVFR